MSEQEQTCATCGAWVDGAGCPRRGADDRSVACCYTDEVVKYPHWTPKPTAAPAMPTLAELDDEIATCGDGWHQTGDMLRAIRPLVEAKECKAAIEAAGYRWIDAQGCKVRVALGSISSSDPLFDDWPSARAWALAQKSAREEEAAKQLARERIASAGAKLEECGANGAVWWVVYTADGMMATFTPPFDKPGEHYYIRAADFAEAHRANGWSKPVHTMDAPEWDATVRALGGDGVPPGYGEGYVVGYAVKCNAFSFAGGRVWLGDGPMPQ
jgi:hypothetical protein